MLGEGPLEMPMIAATSCACQTARVKFHAEYFPPTYRMHSENTIIAGSVKEMSLLCKPLPCNPAEGTALHPLIWGSESLRSNGPPSPEGCLSQTPVCTAKSPGSRTDLRTCRKSPQRSAIRFGEIPCRILSTCRIHGEIPTHPQNIRGSVQEYSKDARTSLGLSPSFKTLLIQITCGL